MGLLNTTQQAYYQNENYGNYQFVSLEDIINQFLVVYVGEGKLISKVSRTDIAFHAQRAIQELSFDTFKSCKSQEITLPPSLTMILPQDYVNYTKITWTDDSGIEHVLYPASKTSNPINPLQNNDGDFSLTAIGTLSLTTDEEHIIVLDSEYKNILVGMVVDGPNIPDGSTVLATSNSGGITTIQISNDVTYAGTETLTFMSVDGSLILEKESAYILENVTWEDDEDKITQAPNTDVSNIEVGMLVSHELFAPLTTVIDVNGAVITTSNIASGFSGGATATPGLNDEVTFISPNSNSDTWDKYKSSARSTDLSVNYNNYSADTDIYDFNIGQRFGIDPQHAQANGSFYINCNTGLIHFSSNISGKTVILHYISDGLGTDAEMKVHKFAEEAMYKWISHAVISTKLNIPEYIIQRLKKERKAAIRTAKLRLSNIKLEEITQILRGKSKQIKH